MYIYSSGTDYQEHNQFLFSNLESTTMTFHLGSSSLFKKAKKLNHDIIKNNNQLTSSFGFIGNTFKLLYIHIYKQIIELKVLLRREGIQFKL